MVGGMILKGLIAGFVAVAPIGPMGTLCIKRSLTHGRLSGLCTGMGVAAGDINKDAATNCPGGWILKVAAAKLADDIDEGLRAVSASVVGL
jgi:hypothetical protein